MSKPTVSAAGGAMPAEGHKTHRAAGFLRLMALRQAVEKTLGEMAAVLDAVDAPDRVAPVVPDYRCSFVAIPVRCDRRAPR